MSYFEQIAVVENYMYVNTNITFKHYIAVFVRESRLIDLNLFINNHHARSSGLLDFNNKYIVKKN